MTKNVFIKSVLRQPVRHLVLALLIAAAAFSFTLRAAEFVVVDSEMSRLEGFYHAIGHINYTDWASFIIDPTGFYQANWHVNFVDFHDSAWFDLIAASPYVDVVDDRRPIAGEIEGFIHADFIPTNFNFDEILGRVYVNDAYFFGTLIEIRRLDNPVEINGHEHVFAIFHVDEIIIGFPEIIEVGELMRFVMPIDAALDAYDSSLNIGQQFLLRGVYETTLLMQGINTAVIEIFWQHGTHPAVLRESGGFNAPLDPLALFALPIVSGGDMYFVHADDPVLDDVLSAIQQQIDLLSRNMRTMRVLPTYDMAYIPFFEEHLGLIAPLRMRILEGRPITREDSENGNRVAVINYMFAATRGVGVGDTITITLREYAPIALPAPDVTPAEWASWHELVFDATDYSTRGWRITGVDFTIPDNHTEWQDFRTIKLELEVVGISSYLGNWHSQGASHNTSYTQASTHVYIPAGLIPRDFARLDHWIARDTMFGFALHSVRYMNAFIEANQEALAEMGYTLNFIYRAGGQAFFDAADNITAVLTFNIITFAVVSALVLLLAVFIYMLLARRNFTITRMLGGKKGKAIVAVIAPALLFWTPFIAAGAIAAWFLALSTASSILYDLPRTVEYIVTPDMTWLLLFIGAILAAVLLLISISAVILSRRPILQLMQAKGK